jgi:predicted phosphodiesterase
VKVIKHNLGDFDTVDILPLADTHIGDIHSDFKKLREQLDWVMAAENRFVILNGDLVDMAVRNSIGDIYSQNLTPMEGLEQCVKIFGPVKDRVLSIQPGNHELRIWRTDGIDFTQILCRQLDIADRYSNASSLLFVRFGKRMGTQNHHGRPVCYTIFCEHGSGGGRTEGAKINRLVQMANIIDADIYVHSHTHTPVITKNSFFRVSCANSSVSKIDRLFVNTSSLMEYGGYGELQGFKPNSLDTPIIHLDGRHRNMTATL